MTQFSSKEITKLMDVLIGNTEPVADSAVDEKVESNLKNLIDIVNWCLDGVYSAASYRKSPYHSEMAVGERAYAAMLEWKAWLENIENELA